MNESHLKALRILADNPALSQRDIAKALNLSLGKVNAVINTLIENGAIRPSRLRNSRNTRAYRYSLTPFGVKTRRALSLSVLAEKSRAQRALDTEIRQLRREIADISPQEDAEQ